MTHVSVIICRDLKYTLIGGEEGRKKSQECGFQAVFLKANDLYK